MDKDFYVSPFIEMDGRYTVRVRDEPARLRIAINETQGDGLAAAHEPRPGAPPLTDRMVLRMLVRHPLVTHKTIGMIHWHALRLWLRGVRSIATARRPMTSPRPPRSAAAARRSDPVAASPGAIGRGRRDRGSASAA